MHWFLSQWRQWPFASNEPYIESQSERLSNQVGSNWKQRPCMLVGPARLWSKRGSNQVKLACGMAAYLDETAETIFWRIPGEGCWEVCYESRKTRYQSLLSEIMLEYHLLGRKLLAPCVCWIYHKLPRGCTQNCWLAGCCAVWLAVFLCETCCFQSTWFSLVPDTLIGEFALHELNSK